MIKNVTKNKDCLGGESMKWMYKIQGSSGTIVTSDPYYAEKKSRLGNIVFCKRKNHIYKYH